jgi:protein-tyrosine phosphatase
MMVTDFHSHILPGLDDGSSSIEMSIEMLKAEAAQGVTHVVATPHFYPQSDSPERFLEKRARAEERLRQEMAKHEGMPQLTVGAEVYYFGAISESDILPGLTIGENRCILIEMPNMVWSDGMYRELAGIYEKQGLVPIIAHVDRYISPFHMNGIPEKLEELPVYVQANAASFLRWNTRHMMLRLLRHGQIHLLGSDCHDMGDRSPNLSDAVKQIRKSLGEEAIEHIKCCEDELLFGV